MTKVGFAQDWKLLRVDCDRAFRSTHERSMQCILGKLNSLLEDLLNNHFRWKGEMVRPERIELPTSWFVAMRSIQLSYGRILVTLRLRLRIITQSYLRNGFSMRTPAILCLALRSSDRIRTAPLLAAVATMSASKIRSLIHLRFQPQVRDQPE